jgi:hypothetical protein
MNEVWEPRSSSIFGCHGPVRTVSLTFRCEQMLGKPSIHGCNSQQQFGLRGSNSHFQVQSLASCQLDETRARSQSGVGLERFELSSHGVKIRYVAVTPQTPLRDAGERQCVYK